MLGTLERYTILRLRVFDRGGSDLDPLALRGRLENVLSDVSLEPRLPPSATLFIRKFQDPLPGSIQLDSPHARAPQAWRHAFQKRFDPVSYTHLRAHETPEHLVCRLLLEKKKH